jgi:DNA-binding MarR family transcriptional regulator
VSDARQLLIERLGAAVRRYQRTIDAFDDAVAAKLGVNRTDLRCLDWLADGPMTVGELAAAVGLTSAAATTLIDRLERRGYVVRQPDESDRRRTIVVPTGRLARHAAQIYGPLATLGVEATEPHDDVILGAICRFLEDSQAITDRHRALLSTIDLDG